MLMARKDHAIQSNINSLHASPVEVTDRIAILGSWSRLPSPLERCMCLFEAQLQEPAVHG